MVRTREMSGKLTGRIALLAPYDARSAISLYAAQIARAQGERAIVLTEDLPAQMLRDRAANVISCYSRGSEDLTRLSAALKTHDVQILHVLVHNPMFSASAFTPVLDELRARGGRVIFELLDTTPIDENLLMLCRAADQVIVSSQQLGLELTAAGIHHERLSTLRPTPFQGLGGGTESESRAALELKSDEKLIIGLMLGASRLEMTQLVDAAAKVRSKIPGARLLIVPLESGHRVEGRDYVASTFAQGAEAGVPDFVSIREQACSAEELRKLLPAASAVVFSQASPSVEMSQALLLALSLKRSVIAPAVEPFVAHAERIFTLNPRMGLSQALAAVVSNAAVRGALAEACGQWAESHSWDERANDLADVYLEVAGRTAARPSASAPTRTVARGPAPRTPRILMQCRDNAYTHPGGDTVVMDRISEGLRARGVIVDIDTRAEKNPREYDLVHLYNFALKDKTEALAKACSRQRVPYIVTTLYEDWPLFYSQMSAHYGALDAYLASGQDAARWPELLKQAKTARPSPIWDNSLTANDSAVLVATGELEARALRRDYPAAKRVEICPLGADGYGLEDGGELFRRETGLSDFVFCVGRFELRKNQLMLLKALEDSDLTVVFAGGGFSYQPAYAEACRKLKRKGKTVFLDRLDSKMLASAFQAARLHALPGWLELPGLVSLEAAASGRNVVVSDFGTIRDYLGDFAFYCRPDEPETIKNAVTAAYYSEPKAGLREQALSFTWDRCALSYGEVYQSVLASKGDFDWSFLREERISVPAPREQAQASIETASKQAHAASQTVGMIPVVIAEPVDEPKHVAAAKKLCDEGDRLAKSGDPGSARTKYEAAMKEAPLFARPYRSCGALALNERRFPEAEKFFVKALEVDAEDCRSYLGLGSVHWEQERRPEAFQCFLKGAQKDPNDSLAIFHLVRTAYAMDRLEDLEHSLRAFLKNDPDNINILYCLAGCSYRRKRLFLAQGVVDRILKLNPEHVEARELKAKIIEEQLASRKPATNGTAGSVASTAAVNEAVVGTSSPRTDERLRELDQAKQYREYDEVIIGAKEILNAPGSSPAQRDLARALSGEALACKGQLEEADRLFAQLEGSAELAHRALAGRGAVLAAEGKILDARRYFERALEHSPCYDVALAGLGVCASQENKNEEAWAHFEKALRVNPENRRALYGVIQLGYIMKRLPETAKALETYLDLHPIDLSMNYSYAGCCYALGDRERALEECRKILLFDAKHRYALELIEKIEGDAKQTVHAR